MRSHKKEEGKKLDDFCRDFVFGEEKKKMKECI